MISKRLTKIVDLIDRDQNTADIGSDHGYVLIELRKKGFKSKLLGVENKKLPYERLKQNTSSYKNFNILCDLSDGIDNLTEEFKTVIIAGMGFLNIKEIIEKNIKKLDYIDTFMIDAHTDKKLVRPFFVNLGYEVSEECIIAEDGIYYDLIRFRKTSEKQNYSDSELEFGPLNLKRQTTEFKKMIIDEVAYNESILNKIINTKATEKISLLNERNSYLKNFNQVNEPSA